MAAPRWPVPALHHYSTPGMQLLADMGLTGSCQWPPRVGSLPFQIRLTTIAALTEKQPPDACWGSVGRAGEIAGGL